MILWSDVKKSCAMLCWRRWHKCEREKKRERNSLHLAVEPYLLDTSSLSDAPPPLGHCFLLPFRFTAEATYAVLPCGVRVCCCFVSMLHHDKENWVSLTRLFVSLFTSTQAMLFFPFRFCVCRKKEILFRGNIRVCSGEEFTHSPEAHCLDLSFISSS